jgi:hypothetical protein
MLDYKWLSKPHECANARSAEDNSARNGGDGQGRSIRPIYTTDGLVIISFDSREPGLQKMERLI